MFTPPIIFINAGISTSSLIIKTTCLIDYWKEKDGKKITVVVQIAQIPTPILRSVVHVIVLHWSRNLIQE